MLPTFKSPRRHTELTFQEKVELINQSEGKTHTHLAQIYGIGRSQVSSILKRKEEILEAYKQNNCSDRKRIVVCANEEINNLTWNWFQRARSMEGVSIKGPMVKEKAKEFARELGREDFKASNGWLESFRKRHGITFSTATGLSAGEGSSVDSERERNQVFSSGASEFASGGASFEEYSRSGPETEFSDGGFSQQRDSSFQNNPGWRDYGMTSYEENKPNIYGGHSSDLVGNTTERDLNMCDNSKQAIQTHYFPGKSSPPTEPSEGSSGTFDGGYTQENTQNRGVDQMASNPEPNFSGYNGVIKSETEPEDCHSEDKQGQDNNVGDCGRFVEADRIACSQNWDGGEMMSFDTWKEKLQTISENYKPRDIYCVSDTVLYYSALPEKLLDIAGQVSCYTEQYMSIQLCCNLLGEFETPCVIGNSSWEKNFASLEREELPVKWQWNTDASLTPELFSSWVEELDQKMGQEGRRIVLYLLNTPSHSLNSSQNIQFIFPPINAFELHPLYHGAIQNFKFHYQKQLLRAVVSQVTCLHETVSSIRDYVSMLDACLWVNQSVKEVKSDLVARGFSVCGFDVGFNSAVSTEEPDQEYEELLQKAVDSFGLNRFNSASAGMGQPGSSFDSFYNRMSMPSSMEMLRSKRVELTLQEKVDLIRQSEGKSRRQLAEKFGVGKSQVHLILKRKPEILDAYESGNIDRKRICARADADDVNRLTWQWFQEMRKLKDISITGPMLQEKAKEFAIQLGRQDFKASNGWLTSFRKRNNITFNTGEGLSAAENNNLTSWKEKLPEVIKDYETKDIFTVSETIFLYSALPDKILGVIGQRGSTKNLTKHRLNTLLCCNVHGEFETPVVVGNSTGQMESPESELEDVPIIWKWSPDAAVTVDIFSFWLLSLDFKMNHAGRNILLFLDHTPLPPADMPLQNVKLVFPPATTFEFNPLKNGVVQDFKLHYQKQLLKKVVSREGDLQENASSISEFVSLVDACWWISQAVGLIKPATAAKAFTVSGFDVGFSPETAVEENDDEFEELVQKVLKSFDVGKEDGAEEGTDTRSRRIELTLQEKVELIRNSDGKSHRQLAHIYGVGKSQVYSLLKRKSEILEAFERSPNSTMKRLSIRTDNDDINKMTWQWYQEISKLEGVPISGTMLKLKAKEFALQLGRYDFKASNGWLDSFRRRNSITFNWKKLTQQNAAINNGTAQESNDSHSESHTESQNESTASVIDNIKQDDDVESDNDFEPEESTIRTMEEAVKLANNLKLFCAGKKLPHLANMLDHVGKELENVVLDTD